MLPRELADSCDPGPEMGRRVEVGDAGPGTTPIFAIGS